MDLCHDCAFCSLKKEQCQNIRNLNRVDCKTGSFISYISPQVSAQHQAAGSKVPRALHVLLASEEQPAPGGGQEEKEVQLFLFHLLADHLPRDLGVLHGGFQRAEERVLVQSNCHLRL